MMQSSARKVTRAWCALVLLTLAGLAAIHFGLSGISAHSLVLALAFAKGHWMIMDFLKLRDVPADWRTSLHVWLLLVTLIPWIIAALPLLRV